MWRWCIGAVNAPIYESTQKSAKALNAGIRHLGDSLLQLFSACQSIKSSYLTLLRSLFIGDPDVIYFLVCDCFFREPSVECTCCKYCTVTVYANLLFFSDSLCFQWHCFLNLLKCLVYVHCSLFSPSLWGGRRWRSPRWRSPGTSTRRWPGTTTPVTAQQWQLTFKRWELKWCPRHG